MKTKKQKTDSLKDNALSLLSDKRLWDIRHSCFQNAAELIEEAEILFDKKHFSRSFFLSYTALEELGKYLVVCDYITGVASKSEFKEIFSDHHLKIAYAHSNAELTKLSNGNLEATIVYDKKKYKEWFNYRNIALYIDIDDKLNVSMPSSKITEDLALKMFSRVKQEYNKIISSEYFNERIGSSAFYR
jgi:AbiV family abortive infection protein